jgi:hypothetical protein
MKRPFAFTLALVSLLFAYSPAQAEDMTLAEEKARRAHEMAASDMMYEQENVRALYYQNQQIIGLLKEIREEMHSINVRAGKDAQTPSEVS